MSYGYDAASRLISINYDEGTTHLGDLAYQYDAAGRRRKMSGSYARANFLAAVTSASYDAANELTQWGAATLSYDADGNLANDGTNLYAWNARNQLVSMGAATFAYDGFSRRALNGAGTSFLYDGVNPVQELSGATPTANLLTGGVDQIFTRTDSAGTRNFLTDALGSTLALADSSGVVQTQYTYEPFGATTAIGATSGNLYQFTGRENDGTGLYYNRARYYDPTIQRFISEDPIGFAGGINLYAYTGNDPVNFRDPFGLDKNGSGCQDLCITTLGGANSAAPPNNGTQGAKQPRKDPCTPLANNLQGTPAAGLDTLLDATFRLAHPLAGC